MGLTKQLQSERQMSEEERVRLINEISVRETPVDEMRKQVRVKSSETDKLQKEVDEQRQRSQYNNHQHFLNEHNGSDDLTTAHVG